MHHYNTLTDKHCSTQRLKIILQNFYLILLHIWSMVWFCCTYDQWFCCTYDQWLKYSSLQILNWWNCTYNEVFLYWLFVQRTNVFHISSYVMHTVIFKGRWIHFNLIFANWRSRRTLGWGTPETYRAPYAIRVVADFQVPNRHQAINNHHAVGPMIQEYPSGTCIILRNAHITL